MRHFKIKKKIRSDIEHEVGDVLKAPDDLPVVSLVTPTGRIRVNLTDEEFFEEITFEKIKEDYETYKYLEDYQVEYLLENFNN